MTSDDDHRIGHRQRFQAADQLDPAHLGHPYIGDDAAMVHRRNGVQESGCRFIGSYGKTGAIEQERKRLAHRLIVIDDMHRRLIHHRTFPPWLRAER